MASTLWRFTLLCGRFRSVIRKHQRLHELIALADLAATHFSPTPTNTNTNISASSTSLRSQSTADDELALTVTLGVTETWRALLRSYGAEMAGSGNAPIRGVQVKAFCDFVDLYCN
jgi:hypothetical protein